MPVLKLLSWPSDVACQYAKYLSKRALHSKVSVHWQTSNRSFHLHQYGVGRRIGQLIFLQCFDSWLGVRKSSQPVKLSDEVLVQLSICSEEQIVCIRSSWCHYHPKTPWYLASLKYRLVSPFWYQLTQVQSIKVFYSGQSNLNHCKVH